MAGLAGGVGLTDGMLLFDCIMTTSDELGGNRGGFRTKKTFLLNWAQIRLTILSALDEFPGAREAVVRALVELRALQEDGGKE